MPPRLKPPKLTREDAETLALRALVHLAEREDLFLRFVALTGMSVDEVRARIGDGATLGAVLDFMLGDEALVIEFATACELPPDTVAKARALLPGAPVID